MEFQIKKQISALLTSITTIPGRMFDKPARFIITGVIVSLIAATIHIGTILYLGLDMTIIFIRSSYSDFFIHHSFPLLIIIFFNTISGFSVFFAYMKNRGLKTPLFLQIIIAAEIIFLLISIPDHAYDFYTAFYRTTTNAGLHYKHKAGPFVQFAPCRDRRVPSTSNAMTVWWFDPTFSKSKIVLKYGTSPDPLTMQDIFETGPTDGKRHGIILTGLMAQTRYYYTIPGFSDQIYSFTTGPDHSMTSSFNILCIGDNHDAGDISGTFYREINGIADITMKAGGTTPAFKINLGDLVFRGDALESWKLYFDAEAVHAPYFPQVISNGNHELTNDNGGNYDYFFNKDRYYSFDYSGVHVMVLDPHDGPFWTTGRKQYEWAQKDLRENTGKRWIIVCIHHPLISTGDFNMNELLIAQYFELFRAYKVDMVLSGHDHHYESFHVGEDTDWGGTLYIINGCGGSRLDGFNLIKRNGEWQDWVHDRRSQNGLYQDDEITRKSHMYGELSWGFMIIGVSQSSLTATYYRWLDLESYLAMTEQQIEDWKIIPATDRNKPVIQKPDMAVPVHQIRKTRHFN